MASMSAISGLVSGLDTKSIISQLMSLAKAPQDDLKTSLAKTNTQITAAQSINSKAASMTSLAKDLATASTYTIASASSSDGSVSATTSATAGSGSVTFRVAALAAAQSTLSDIISDSSSTQTVNVAPKNSSSTGAATPYSGKTAAEIAQNINGDVNAIVSATVVNQANADGTTTSRLQLTAKKAGEANGFAATSTGFDSPSLASTVTTASDAQITIGNTTIKASSNTFTGLMAGVDVTVSKVDAAKDITVSTAANPSAITSKMNSLVTAMNNVLSDVAFHTKALAVGTTASAANGGLLRGNSTLRDLASQVLNSVSSGTSGEDSATLAGLSVTRQGEVTFDSAAFEKFYRSDSNRAADVLVNFASVVQAAGSLASDSSKGSVTSFISSSQGSVRSLTDNVAGWDARLASKQKRLEAQYGALEVALQKLSGQSDSLTAALKQLNGNNS